MAAGKGPNHYQILGLKPNAADKDIKLCYFQLAKKYHPDVNPDDSAKLQFEKISQAYEVLSDDAKKQVYDQQHGFGGKGSQSGSGGSFRDYHSHKKRRANSTIFSDDEQSDGEDEYYDLYRGRNSDKRTMPGQGGRQDPNQAHYNRWKQQRQSDQFWSEASGKKSSGGGANKEEYRKKVFDEFDEFFDFKRQAAESGVVRDDTRGADYKLDIDVDFVQAVVGTNIEIQLNKRIVCNSCRGSRSKAGSKPRKCFECGGRGSVIGNYNIKKRCTKCEGAGCIPKETCTDCEGIGVQRQVLSEEIELPGGLTDGQKLKVPQMGHAADVYTSQAGDLLLTVNVKNHDVFERVSKQDVRIEVELTLAEAILGTDMTISTVHGPINIHVEPGTSTGDQKVLKHFGVPEFDPPDNYDPLLLRGDQIVVFKVRLPEQQSAEMKEILEKMIKNEEQNKEAYYAFQTELKKQREAEIYDKMEKKRKSFKAKQEQQASSESGKSSDKKQNGNKNGQGHEAESSASLGGWVKSLFGS